jgi:hypothetical protein|tara:strand:+ start:155 stop:352 length:198 start_codon:yes stop_codon:yes gene_type:complete
MDNLADSPWWLEPGAEHCDFCQHRYHYEAGYHCVYCDRPVCPVCVVWVRAEHAVACPECAEEEES